MGNHKGTKHYKRGIPVQQVANNTIRKEWKKSTHSLFDIDEVNNHIMNDLPLNTLYQNQHEKYQKGKHNRLYDENM